MKMKSSHDVLQDPKLSSQPVVETTAAVLKVWWATAVCILLKWCWIFHDSLRASSLRHSGRGTGKRRRACNYVLFEFEYLHQKSRCEMLIGGDDISNDIITLGTCFSALRWLAKIWQLSQWGATGEVLCLLSHKNKRLVFLSTTTYNN